MDEDQIATAAGGGNNDPGRSTDAIRTAAQDTKDAVQSAFHDAADKVGHAASEAMAGGEKKVEAASDGAAEALRAVAAQLHGAAGGLNGEQAWAEKAFRTGAAGLERVSDYLSTGQFDDFAKDLQTFAKANPAAFLAGSVAVGVLVARIGKTAVRHAADAGSPAADPSSVAGADSPRQPPTVQSAMGEI